MNAHTNLLSLRDADGDTKRLFGPKGALGFPIAIAIDGKVYVGGQFAAADGDIGAQTAAAFDGLQSALGEFDADMTHLLNLRTYYVYEGGEGKDVTDFWEKMTQVRLRYLADPGPAATALRVVGAPAPGKLITVDGIGVPAASAKRIMPEDSWDWSIPTPFSQGWLVGDTIYLGGQIAADRKGAAVAVGDVEEQARIALRFIHNVLTDGGHDWNDLTTLRIGYQAGNSPEEGRATLDKILAVVRETIPGPRLPTLNAFGVDLLYEGLMLEIDGISIKSRTMEIVPPGSHNWMQFEDHPVAILSGTELYIGGLSAPGGASLVAQTEASIDRLNVTLREAGLGYENLVKLTLLYAPDEDEAAAGVETITTALSDYIPAPGPVVSIVRVKNLPFPGQRVQLDAVAIR